MSPASSDTELDVDNDGGLEEAIAATITEEDIARAKAQIGIMHPRRGTQWAPVPDLTSMAHFAEGIGDDNPLWLDRSYAMNTRWRDVIAPPMFLVSAGVNVAPKYDDPEMQKLFKGLFVGVGRYYSGSSWEWLRPVYAGTALYHDGRTTVAVEVKDSSFSGSRSVKEIYRTVFSGPDGLPVAVQEELYINAERGGSHRVGKFKDVERKTYTPKEIEEINAAYAAEKPRGAEPRWWEDVEVGDDVGPILKGPLLITDLINFHMGFGWGIYGVPALRLAGKHRVKMPHFYVDNEFGIPDAVQRLHWDEAWARRIGLPAPYDYGQMRTCWLSHLATDWVGDDGWVWKLDTNLRTFNFMGDLLHVSGTVTEKWIEEGHAGVTIDLSAINQRGEASATGAAKVLLPSREHGPVVLPNGSAETRRRAAQVTLESLNRYREKL